MSTEIAFEDIRQIIQAEELLPSTVIIQLTRQFKKRFTETITASLTTDDVDVTGSGFTENIKPGDYLYSVDDGIDEAVSVAEVTNDSNLILDWAYRGEGTGDTIIIRSARRFEGCFNQGFREFVSITKGGDPIAENYMDLLAVAHLTISALFVLNKDMALHHRDLGYKACLSAYGDKIAGGSAKASSRSLRTASNPTQINKMLPKQEQPRDTEFI